ncbi:DUF4304 domain-containing protein [Chryseobacterium paludis]|uniref:DUF4304 domain-containing protein n=1 Tax=Chryseobacterium paludis TaxID=2956784 RepID=UPI0021C12A4E|nr:DUF4304 domain-containing protein [Chryseobacterium paludis]
MDKFQELISRIGKELKLKGWSKKANTFYFSQYNNWGLLYFQRSVNNQSNKTSFTINLGVSSTVIRAFNEDDLTKRPPFEDSHWTLRIGDLMPGKRDYWWEIDDNIDLEVLYLEIKDHILKLAVPKIELHLSDSALEENWLKKETSGPEELKRLINLTVLLKYYKKDSFDSKVLDLINYTKNNRCEYLANVHLTQLNNLYATK